MPPTRFFSFQGRMRRKHYLLIFLAVFALRILIGFVEHSIQINLGIITLLLVAAIVPATARRLHDMGYSGWMVIGVILIPFLSLLLLLLAGQPGSNAYGADPKSNPA